MGQKVNPIGLRLGVIRSWDSMWYTKNNIVPKFVVEDRKIRNFIHGQYKDGSLSCVEIERYKKDGNKDVIKLKVFTAKPGLVVGRDGEIKKRLVKNLEKLTKKEIEMNIVEVKLAERNAQIIADSMARKLEARASFRRVQKLAIQRALKLGAKGIKTLVSGRLGGTEIARGEGYAEGQVPLHTLRADIDYATAEALTKYGILGIKVWVYQGEILPGENRKDKLLKEEEKYTQGLGKGRGPRKDGKRPVDFNKGKKPFNKDRKPGQKPEGNKTLKKPSSDNNKKEA